MPFFKQLDENRFAAQWETTGPWTEGAQHLGPPSALMTRALEAVPGELDARIASITVDILGPVPVGELTVSASLDRPGRSVELLSAHLSAGDRVVARATAWRIIASDSEAVRTSTVAPLAPVEQSVESPMPEGWGRGYIDAMEWRSLTGGFGEPGPAALWVRQRIPLVDEEEPSPLQRLMTVADSGSGASNMLRPDQWWFINTALTVHIHREPDGEWIGLDASTTIGPGGLGTARSELHDVHGHVAGGSQPLMIRPR
ncbi:thioesterase family protein [Sciscionella sediminilitoris]|uniref:thioesterase family protein n=1 Tax=Sciscionella sediminilitoris TaxID=1445613 RepID=UPI0004DF1DCE|nr:thioesterase family protein [Sciscionella sp. SE31]